MQMIQIFKILKSAHNVKSESMPLTFETGCLCLKIKNCENI